MTLFLHLFVLAKHHSVKHRNTGSSGVLIARVGFFQCLVICMWVSASSNLTIKHSLCSVLIYLNWTGLVWSYRWKWLHQSSWNFYILYEVPDRVHGFVSNKGWFSWVTPRVTHYPLVLVQGCTFTSFYCLGFCSCFKPWIQNWVWFCQ